MQPNVPRVRQSLTLLMEEELQAGRAKSAQALREVLNSNDSVERLAVIFAETRDEGKRVAEFEIKGGGAQAPGAFVLRELPKGHASAASYAVHFYNHQDGGYHDGNYTDSLAKAWQYFGERVGRFA